MQESGNKSQISLHSLSIRTVPDGFSFCFFTAKGFILKNLKIPTKFDFPERFENFVQSRGWTEKENLQVTIIDFADHFMVLPEKITDEEQIRTFFDFQFQHDEANQIFTVPMNNRKLLFSWEIPDSRNQHFKKLFPHLTILSSAYLLANWTIREASNSQKPYLVAHLFGKYMHIFVADTQNLLFANSFKIKTIQEIPYFLLRCIDQLSLNPLQTRCTFCCESVSEQNITDIFKPYIKNIELATFTHQAEDPLHITDIN